MSANEMSPTRNLRVESPVRLLIVEDDVTMEPLWRYVIEVASPGAVIEWMTSAEAAEVRLRSQAFSLVIADIFLNGEKTGLDLWDGLKGDNFLLMSVLTPSRLMTLALDVSRELPPYIQKPLDPSQCIETIRALLRASSGR